MVLFKIFNLCLAIEDQEVIFVVLIMEYKLDVLIKVKQKPKMMLQTLKNKVVVKLSVLYFD